MEKRKKCLHDFIFLDKWQDANATYWEFACRYCLAIKIRGQTHTELVKDMKKVGGL